MQPTELLFSLVQAGQSPIKPLILISGLSPMRRHGNAEVPVYTLAVHRPSSFPTFPNASFISPFIKEQQHPVVLSCNQTRPPWIMSRPYGKHSQSTEMAALISDS